MNIFVLCVFKKTGRTTTSHVFTNHLSRPTSGPSICQKFLDVGTHWSVVQPLQPRIILFSTVRKVKIKCFYDIPKKVFVICEFFLHTVRQRYGIFWARLVSTGVSYFCMVPTKTRNVSQQQFLTVGATS